jgi:YjbE family integral membrane protein
LDIGSLAPALVKIMIYNLILSGDNAVVIGMAAHMLPERQRRAAIMFGAVAAVVLRIILTVVAAFLLQIPAVKIVGGILLMLIAFRLLKEEEEEHEGAASETLRGAIWTIVVADLVMSLDNVLAIAAEARGNMGLLIFGLLLSMPIVMFAGGLVARLLDVLWWLAYVGSALIAWTGAEMVLDDQFVAPYFHELELLHTVLPWLTAIVVVGAAHYFHRHRPRAVRASRLATDAPGDV